VESVVRVNREQEITGAGHLRRAKIDGSEREENAGSEKSAESTVRGVFTPKLARGRCVLLPLYTRYTAYRYYTHAYCKRGRDAGDARCR
jgi:hypothetical protein